MGHPENREIVGERQGIKMIAERKARGASPDVQAQFSGKMNASQALVAGPIPVACSK